MRQVTDQAPEPFVSHLRSLKAHMMTTLEAIDFALANAGGGDLVSWAGTAQHEQRCKRCSYWIFMGDPVCAVMIEPGNSIYVHRKCVVRIANAEEGRSGG